MVWLQSFQRGRKMIATEEARALCLSRPGNSSYFGLLTCMGSSSCKTPVNKCAKGLTETHIWVPRFQVEEGLWFLLLQRRTLCCLLYHRCKGGSVIRERWSFTVGLYNVKFWSGCSLHPYDFIHDSAQKCWKYALWLGSTWSSHHAIERESLMKRTSRCKVIFVLSFSFSLKVSAVSVSVLRRRRHFFGCQ